MRPDSNKDVKVIYKKIEPEFLNKFGYINLNHREVNTKEELVQIASIFRNPMYETLRIVYVNKDDKIVGYESITSKAPRQVSVFPKSKSGRSTSEKSFYKIKDRMRRLDATGYYLVHNHPSGNAKASKDDLEVTEIFNNEIKGFKGHLIVNTESYAWIDVDDKYGIAIAENYIEIKNYKRDKYYKMLNKKSIYDMKIKSRTDLVMLMHHIKNTKDYSSLIFADAQGKVRMILDMPNRFLNMSTNQMEGFIKKQKMLNGATKVFFATSDNDYFCKSIKYWEKGIFKDSMVYKEENDKIYTYEKLRVKKEEKLDCVESFGLAHVSVSEIDSEFEGGVLSLDNEDKDGVKKNVSDLEEKQKMLKVLLKKVGQKPQVIEIPDTLEAKQNIVGGLIEIVQYDDIVLVCNEEGKLLNMPPNLIFEFDYIAGDCFLMGENLDTGEWRSLSQLEIDRYTKDLDSRSFKWRVEEEYIPSKEKQRGERMRGKS